MEALVLVNKKTNLTRMARILNIYKSSTTDRLKGLIKKGLVIHKDHLYRITKQGKEICNNRTGTSSVQEQTAKNIHHNEFTFDIRRLPNRWYEGERYFEGLNLKNFFRNDEARQVFIHFNDCKIRISETALKGTIWIKKQMGRSFDQIQSRVWDLFVKYYNLLKQYAFQLHNIITSPNPQFADPTGFFAALANYSTKKGFRIETQNGDFWVDYSPPGDGEEETDTEANAVRMEQLSKSAFNSKSDFNDLDKVVEISKNLVKVSAMKYLPVSTEQTNIGQIPKYIG